MLNLNQMINQKQKLIPTQQPHTNLDLIVNELLNKIIQRLNQMRHTQIQSLMTITLQWILIIGEWKK